MQRYRILGTLLLIPALALVFMVGCTKPVEKPVAAKDKDKKDKDKDGGEVKEITSATKATVKGVVKVDAKPEMKGLADDSKFQAHNDKAFCSSDPKDLLDQRWVVDNDLKVGNAVVFLVPGDGKAFKVTDELKKTAKEKPLVVVDQPVCQYHPRVSTVLEGVQEFQAKNSAKIKHSFKFTASTRNGSANGAIESGKTSDKYPFKAQPEPIKIECGDHTWMAAYVWVFNHPYYAITKSDGSFEIPNVPIDEDLTVVVWHEVPGKKELAKQKFKEGNNDVNPTISSK